MGENVARGQKGFENMRPAEVAKWATDATQAERDAAFSGYGNFLLKKLTTATNPAVFVGDANRMGRMRALSGNPAEMDALEAALKREADLFAQRGKSLTGVTQAVKEAARADINTALEAGNVDVISAALRSRNPGYFAGLALKVLSGKNYPPEVLTELTRVLKSGTPDDVARVAAELVQSERNIATREVGRVRLRDAASVAAGKVGAGREEPGLDVEGIPSYGAAPDTEQVEEPVDPDTGPRADNPGARISPPETKAFVSSLSPQEAKALAIVAEAGPDIAEMRGVGHVLENRAKNPSRYGEDIYSILTDGEFDAFNTAPDKLMELRNSPRFKRALGIVANIESGKDADPTSGATHYLAPALMKQKGYNTPSWARSGGLTIGASKFFRVD